ncbi:MULTISPECIES: DUF2968 domain-containing protein [Burkholderia]|jgi:type I site-specific restriction endonuclease|uniref:DUF2968 domain-containing protein n=1 Tax=Burkholderia gladioli TaxID=28095 RepID=A0A095X3J2_BURGA|nr:MULTISPECIES: DUF2968 domain-containing protein [Burkholderia]AJX00441.1 hypothetical protein BM43_3117 [Burkholderia gladioli]ASD79084.1 hypothetical protein CEJ98_08710 [Burkholderia gladioli pv. gladioli]ATF84498.1 DUF2968 domain-containing protein [Burkholderia gladioli pv. gladioli]AWY55673.1 hypothetical protein A8H28_32445 [Burkholderia gladioli pv. gladioli]AYQ88200.1 DUF2968 domain-containing protein [Burkholderia gladioli]
MSHKRVLGRTFIAGLVVAGGFQVAQAQGLAGSDNAAPAVSPAAQSSGGVVNSAPAAPSALPQAAQPTAGDGAGTTQSTIDELQQQIQSHALTEMRTAYNGSYGASLLFNIKDGTYYVALFQQKAFWRVIKTSNEARAEAVFRDFSKQAESLAASELQAARLEAQKAQTDKQIAVVQDRANRLQADLQIAREQQAAVNNRQKATRSETASLQAQRDALQAQLRQLQMQVRSLQRQADAGLPGNQ